MMKFNDARDWFFEKRFGFFVHWGLYAINGVHEQEWQRFDVPAETYRKLFDKFSPSAFDPEEWLDMAQDAGMDYMVFTAKHHDGFCLWNSASTDFNSVKAPFGRDVLGEIADACHKRGMPLEIYYSIVDWSHEAYPNIGRHHEIVTPSCKHDMNRYMGFLKEQIKELCSNYGRIHGIWWDMNVEERKDPSVNAMIRELQPCAVINNRGFDEGDCSTPERDWDPEGANPDDMAFKRPTEACQSIGVNAWGFRKNEDCYSALHIMRSIDKTLAMGGNYLLNAGPDGEGRFPEEAKRIFKTIGAWMRKVRESFVEPWPGALDRKDVFVCKKGSSLYVHCPFGLESSTLNLRPLKELPAKATLLNTGARLETTLEPIVYERPKGPALRIVGIPVDELCGTVPVFRLDF